MNGFSTLFAVVIIPTALHTMAESAPADVLRILQGESGVSGTRAGCTTHYGGCNCGPCCEKFAQMGCTKHQDMSRHSFFRENGMIYGTVAAGVFGSNVEWTTCGACYEVTLGPNCSTLDWSSGHAQCTVAPSDWGCQAVNKRILGSQGTKAIVMVTNRCAECTTGHFDVCEDNNYGNVGFAGMDNPTAAYKTVDCPAALLNRFGCPSGGGGGGDDQCTANEADPFSSGSEVKCCAGMKKCLRASANWAYRCQPCSMSCPDDESAYAAEQCQPDKCTPNEADPFSTGSEVRCCAGMKKCLRASANWAYRCQACSMSCPDDESAYATEQCQS